jgi:hypothetical protein
MGPFFLKPLTSRHKLSVIRPEGSYSEEQRERETQIGCSFGRTSISCGTLPPCV